MLWMCFAVGLNNFALGRLAMAEIEGAVRSPLEAESLNLVAWFGHTGNMAVQGEAGDRERIAWVLAEATLRPWAVVLAETRSAALDALSAFQKPVGQPLTRWTPGLVIAVGQAGKADSVHSTNRVALSPLV